MDPGRSHRGQEGSASVELVTIVPALIVATLVAGQLALAGHALWSAGIAARAGARAAHVGGDPKIAARHALPGLLRRSAQVRDEDGVSVEVAVPRLLPLLPRIAVGAHTSLEPAPGA